ncbi:MAG: GxxExxY protein [Terrimicrobiaceae bacterium]
MTEVEAKAVADQVRMISLNLHSFLKWGHLEKVYENGLAHRLQKSGFCVQQQYPISVRDEDGTVLGDYVADLIVDSEIIIEIKACDSLADIHIAQILGYLRATGLRHGLLINFGAPVLQIRKLVL